MVRWMIQGYPGTTDPSALAAACAARGSDFEFGPWDDSEVPIIEAGVRSVFYGSCRFIENLTARGLHQSQIFGSEREFHYSCYMANYRDNMLNADAIITTLAEVGAAAISGKFFLREAGDSKKITGSLWTRSQLDALLIKLQSSGDAEALRLPVVYATRKVIDSEWRLFVVDGVVSSGSQSMAFGEPCRSSAVPAEVVRFVENLVTCWSPARVFVIDVALMGGKLSVVELNGFNSSGFYSSNIVKVISDVEAVLDFPDLKDDTVAGLVDGLVESRIILSDQFPLLSADKREDTSESDPSE